MADVPLGRALHGAARAALPDLQRALGDRRSARADRAGGALPYAVRVDGEAGQSDDRRGKARRGALRRPDGTVGDPRAAGAVAALPRAPAMADGAVLADRHPRV